MEAKKNEVVERKEPKKKLDLMTFMVKNMEKGQYDKFESFCNERGVSFGQAIPFLMEAHNTLHKTGRITEVPEEKEKKEGRFGG